MNWRLILGALALVLGRAACGESGEGDTTPTCEAGEMRCGGACADTSSDPRNCGACGTSCGDGELCIDGACELACPAGQLACDGGCYDLDTSAANCGACGTSCGVGEACAEGRCVTSCPAGQVECGGGCFDTDTSLDNCGACGVACGSGETCTDGACVAACPGGQELCDGACVDLDRSRDHCGVCGNACGEGEVCSDGACAPACGPGQTNCDGTCANLATDAANCGTCGSACRTGEVCVDGGCELFCAGGLTACGDACVDMQNDRNHCGACGTACGDAEICSEGQCVTSCGGFASDLCGDSCTNVDTDPLNCGGCGNACDAGEVCSAGVCTGFCDPSLTACGEGVCTSLDDDPANCGACGEACGTVANGAPVCSTGACDVVCLGGYGDCNGDMRSTGGDGCEVTFATDLNNCGFCGNTCAAPANGTPACVAGTCGVAACNTGWGNCDGSDFNGCEVEFSSDPANCGACGIVCDAGEYCGGGECKPRTAADHCLEPYVLTPGQHTLYWHATGSDYLTAAPSCYTGSRPVGPDLVFQYTATYDGQVEFTVNKPSGSGRWHLVATSGLCGPLEASDEAACFSSQSTGNVTFPMRVTNGTTYNLFLAGTASGVISDPLRIGVAELDCATLQPTATVLTPDNGATNPTLSGTFTARFSHKVDGAAANFTITTRSGDVVQIPATDSRVTFGDDALSVTIDAGEFRPEELVTITWSGVNDAVCGVAVPSPTWQVTMPQPPCAPGAGGVIGRTMTRYPVGFVPGTSFSEGYLAADADPDGWIYMGTSSALWRVRKGGGVPEDLYEYGVVAGDQLGTAVIVDGRNVYTLDNAANTTKQLWRISEDGGNTREPVDTIVFPVQPGRTTGTSSSSFNGAAVKNGKAYLITFAAEGRTELWSADLTGALPATAQLEMTFANLADYQFCTGLSFDERFVYTTCRKGGSASTSPYMILRIDRQTHAVAEVAVAMDNYTSGTPIHAADTDGDGAADVLYHKGDSDFSSYVCSPTGKGYIDEHFSFGLPFGTATANGLAFDPVENALWVYERDTYELIKIQ